MASTTLLKLPRYWVIFIENIVNEWGNVNEIPKVEVFEFTTQGFQSRSRKWSWYMPKIWWTCKKYYFVQFDQYVLGNGHNHEMRIIQKSVLLLNWSGSSIINWHLLPSYGMQFIICSEIKQTLNSGMLEVVPGYHIKNKIAA